jgi:hypothetical protein
MGIPDWYILLPDGTTEPTNDITKWSRNRADTDLRRVGIDNIDGIVVSTVFLGLDHNWSESGPPLLFETMVFDHTAGADRKFLDLGCWRYSNIWAARAGHEQVVSVLRDRGPIALMEGFDPYRAIAGDTPGAESA